MLDFLKGKRTILTILFGLGAYILDNALKLNVGSHVADFIQVKMCGADAAKPCLELTKAIGDQLQSIYLGLIGSLAIYFRTQAGK